VMVPSGIVLGDVCFVVMGIPVVVDKMEELDVVNVVVIMVIDIVVVAVDVAALMVVAVVCANVVAVFGG